MRPVYPKFRLGYFWEMVDLPEFGLKIGGTGAVVRVHDDGRHYLIGVVPVEWRRICPVASSGGGAG